MYHCSFLNSICMNTHFYISIIFICNTRLKSAKNQAKAKQHPEAKLLLFEIYPFSSSMLSSKTNLKYSKNVQKNKCVCFNEIIWLVMIKMRMKMKNRSNRYDINRNRPRHGHKYTKYKMYLSVMMVMCNKKHLSNIWSWTHEKLNNTEAELKKKALLIKKSMHN